MKKIEISLSIDEMTLIWLSLQEYKFQTQRNNTRKTKNKLTRLSKNIEKQLYVKVI